MRTVISTDAKRKMSHLLSTLMWIGTSVPRLCMKFPTKNSITTFRGDQRNAKECYSNSLRKAEPKDVNFILMDIDEDDDPEQGQIPKQGNDVEMINAF